jgi:DNA-binding MarR family transcriptional regulator
MPSSDPRSADLLGDAGDSPGFLLWRVTQRWQRAIVAALRPLELTHAQFVLLMSTWWLARRGDGAGPSQREVADHAEADPMMTSQVLRTLERRGLVTRSADGADARVKRLAVTPAGARLARRAQGVVEAADRAFFAEAGDQAALLGHLRELAAWRAR